LNVNDNHVYFVLGRWRAVLTIDEDCELLTARKDV